MVLSQIFTSVVRLNSVLRICVLWLPNLTNKSRMPPEQVEGFKVLPLRVSHASTSCHYLFIKQHSVRYADESKPPDRTLFVLNIPPYATERSLRHCFSIAGSIKSVTFQITEEGKIENDGFKRAYIVFEKRDGLLRTLKLQSLNPLSSEEVPLKVGLEKWIEEHNSSICDPEELQRKINTFMARYDKEEKKKTNKKDITDEDGWTLVTKKGRNPGIARKQSVNDKIQEKVKRGAKKKELTNFYTFQIRESKMKNIAALRKNFEEAKKKVNLMKQARKFKPY